MKVNILSDRAVSYNLAAGRRQQRLRLSALHPPRGRVGLLRLPAGIEQAQRRQPVADADLSGPGSDLVGASGGV